MDIIAFWQVFIVLLTAVLVVAGLVVQAVVRREIPSRTHRFGTVNQAGAVDAQTQPADSVAAAKA